MRGGEVLQVIFTLAALVVAMLQATLKPGEVIMVLSAAKSMAEKKSPTGRAAGRVG